MSDSNDVPQRVPQYPPQTTTIAQPQDAATAIEPGPEALRASILAFAERLQSTAPIETLCAQETLEASKQLLETLRQDCTFLEQETQKFKSQQFKKIESGQIGFDTAQKIESDIDELISQISKIQQELTAQESLLNARWTTWQTDKATLEQALTHLKDGQLGEAEKTRATFKNDHWKDLDAGEFDRALDAEVERLQSGVEVLLEKKRLQGLDLLASYVQTFGEQSKAGAIFKKRHDALVAELEEEVRQKAQAELLAKQRSTRRRLALGALIVTTGGLGWFYQTKQETAQLEKYRVELERRLPETEPEETAYFEEHFKKIPGGSFKMGATDQEDSPPHTVTTKPFLMDCTELTYGEWKKVKNWAESLGYQFQNDGEGGSDDSPVTNINWYDAVKFCNAKSERAGLKPCYYTGSGRSYNDVYRKGSRNLSLTMVDWNANGYRLPTEAEWEKAAGISGTKRYPNGESISRDDANCDNPNGGTKRVKFYPPNEYGLYDMAGNVWEWCWDWYANGYGPVTRDPKGPDDHDGKKLKVVRGGGWSNRSEFCRVSYRDNYGPSGANGLNGMRLVKR